MALDTVQNVSAITELAFTSLKMAGYGAAAVISVLGSEYIKDSADTEKHMRCTVNEWRGVLCHLTEEEKDAIGEDTLIGMESSLNQLDRRLDVLGINLRKSSLWSRTVGKHASDVRKLARLVQQTDDDLRTRTKDTLLSPVGVPLATPVSGERPGDPCRNRIPPATGAPRQIVQAHPHGEIARPTPAASAPGRRLQTAVSIGDRAAPTSQAVLADDSLWNSDYAEDMV